MRDQRDLEFTVSTLPMKFAPSDCAIQRRYIKQFRINNHNLASRCEAWSKLDSKPPSEQHLITLELVSAPHHCLGIESLTDYRTYLPRNTQTSGSAFFQESSIGPNASKWQD